MIPPLHVVTDDRVLDRDGFLESASRVLASGGPRLALHIRGPHTSGRRLHDLCSALRNTSRSAGALLLVNDRVDVARVVAADGVQLGARSLPAEAARELLGPESWIGVSVHDPVEAGSAESEGVDFFLLGTIFPTPSHPGRTGGGVARIRAFRERTDRRMIAIGGIAPGRVREVVAAGADGVAVMRAVWSAPDPAGAVQDFLREL